MERYPSGIGAKGFMAQERVEGFPEWLERVEAPKKDGDGPLSRRARRPIAPVDRQPELHHAARVDVARAEPLSS